MDWYVEDPQVKYDVKVDLDKAALHGVSAADVTRTLQIGLSGRPIGPAARPHVEGRCADRGAALTGGPFEHRGLAEIVAVCRRDFAEDKFRSRELTDVEQTTIEASVYRKNLRPVVYVLGDVAGEVESPVYAIQKMSNAIDQIKTAGRLSRQAIQRHGTARGHRPHYSMKWDGEWHITVEVFRDLGWPSRRCWC